MEMLKPLEHAFKAAFFKVSRLFLKKGRTDFVPLDGNKLKKVLFLRPEKIGDMVISFPVFDGLKAKYPHIKISILGSPRNKAIIKGDTRFERVFMYRKNIWRDFKELLRMRRENFDCVVDMICDDSVTALFLSQYCAPGKSRIGVGKTKHREYYDFNYDHRMGNTGHIIENTLKLLDAFGIDSKSVNGYARPYIDDESMDKVDSFFEGMSDGSDGRLRVGYNLSAGARTRIWDIEKSKELVQKLIDGPQACTVVLMTAPADRFRGDDVERGFDDRVCQVPPGMSLMEASGLLSRLDVLISPDTSMVHIARAFKVPVVGLYSRFMKNFLLWRPYDQEEGAVVSGNDDNIFDITPQQVFDMYVRVIGNMKTVEK